MVTKNAFTLVVGCISLAAVGCSSSDSPAAGPGAGGSDSGASTGGSSGGGSGGKTGTGGTGGAAGADAAADGSTGITISGITHLWDKDDPFSTGPLEGVKVCVRNHPEITCSTSGADGAFAVHGVPKNTKVQVTFEKSDRVSQLRAIETGTADITFPAFENALALLTDVDLLFPSTNVDMAKGAILFFVSGPGSRFQSAFDWVRGFTVSVTPKSGNGPYYLDTHSVYDSTATSGIGGYGFFEDMADGDYTVTFTVPAGLTCTRWANQLYGYQSTTDPLKIDIPVVAGFYTGPTGLYCAPPASDAGPDSGSTDAGGDAGSSADSGTD